MLATINLKSQHELQLLTTFLFSVQVSLTQGKLPVLLSVSVEIPRVKLSLCQKIFSSLECLLLCSGLPTGGEGFWVLSDFLLTALLLHYKSQPCVPCCRPLAREIENCFEVLLRGPMHECGFHLLRRGILFKVLGLVRSQRLLTRILWIQLALDCSIWAGP